MGTFSFCAHQPKVEVGFRATTIGETERGGLHMKPEKPFPKISKLPGILIRTSVGSLM